MRFLVDGMLGGLARWLRILGHDVRYDRDGKDSALLHLISEEDRTLLTRDEELYRRATSRGLASLLVLGETEMDRLAWMAARLGIRLDATMTATRCPECGSLLSKVSKDLLVGEVPGASLRRYNEFWKCTEQSCGKVYWVGSHWRQILRTLEGAKKLANASQ